MPTAAIDNSELVCRLPPDSRIKLIGLGGVGGIVLEYLVLFLRSLNIPLRLVVIDGDAFEPSNGQRMRFGRLGNKAEVRAADVAAHLEGSDVSVVAVGEFVLPDNVDRLVRERDYVFLCVDNHATRRLVSEYASRLSDVTIFSGGNDGVEPPGKRGTFGNVQVAIRRDGRDVTAPITRFHPEIRNASGPLPGGPDCGQLALSSPQILMANLAVASALLNAFFACTCDRLTYQEVMFDILEARSVPQFPIVAAAEG